MAASERSEPMSDAHEQALAPAASRALAKRPSLLPAPLRRALPTLTRSAAGIAAGFAADYAFRLLSRRVRSALAPPLRAVSAVPRRATVTRRVVTEFIVVERVRRR